MLGRRTSLGPVELPVTTLQPPLIVEQLPIDEGCVTTLATVHDGPEIVLKKGEELKFKWEVGSEPCSGELMGFAAS